MKQTRIALVGMSQLMSAMIEQILASQPGFLVAARLRGGADPTRVLRRKNIDVVIARAEAADPGDGLSDSGIGRSFQNRPRKLLAIGQDGQRGVMWVLRPHRTTLDELSAEILLAAIREDV